MRPMAVLAARCIISTATLTDMGTGTAVNA
jgi:hypothetical protein